MNPSRLTSERDEEIAATEGTKRTLDGATPADQVPDYESYDFSRVWRGRRLADEAEKRLMLRYAGGGGETYLDLGGGFGRITKVLEPLYRRVFMLDYSRRNLRSALERLTETTVLVRCALDELPFEDDTFDFISLIRVMHHIPEPAHLLDEIARVGRSGATFVMSVPNPATGRAMERSMGAAGRGAGEGARVGPQGHLTYPTRLERYASPLLQREDVSGVGVFDNRIGIKLERLAPLSTFDVATSRLWPAKAQLFLRFSVRKDHRARVEPAVMCSCGGKIAGGRCLSCGRVYGRIIDLVEGGSRPAQPWS